MVRTIDLNSDLGEGAGYDDEILSLVSSANVACGFHAGTPASIMHTIQLAKASSVAVGAHPSFADRENFGRTEMRLPASEVYALVAYQVGAFRAVCEAAGVTMNHVKPHGALYNMAMRDQALAEAVAHGILAGAGRTSVFVLPGSKLEEAAREVGLEPVREFFADRAYLASGELVPRSRPDALLHDPVAAAARVVQMLQHQTIRSVEGEEIRMRAETVCVHGDTPGAVKFVQALRACLEKEKIKVAAPPSVS